MIRHGGIAVAVVLMIATGVVSMWPSAPPRAVHADAAPPKDTPAPEVEDVTDPLGPNGACYVCHITFVRESLSKQHLEAKVRCVDCHGQSSGHANDEDIGATKPDRMYEREDISGACRECHESHDVAPEAVVERWLELGLTERPPVCTDCHGEHRIG